MTQQTEAQRLADALLKNDHECVEAAAELRRLEAVNAQLLEACQTFAEWLRREEDGFDHKTHDRETPEGESAWRDWFYENLRICDLAQKQARTAIEQAESVEPVAWLTKELMADYLDMIAEAIEDNKSEMLRHKAYWMRKGDV